ncbi:MAG: hypothetical protein HOV96_21920 [Nonomuraea sp.]|nr:hypothetical protein [Nonomuraea sp.]NUP80201.1 hypothetical protein [Nonomuraea sp.]
MVIQRRRRLRRLSTISKITHATAVKPNASRTDVDIPESEATRFAEAASTRRHHNAARSTRRPIERERRREAGWSR